MSINIEVAYKKNVWIADGDGIALTVFVDKSSGVVSLQSTNVRANGDIEQRVWIESIPLEPNEQIRVRLVTNSSATPPASFTINSLANQEAEKRKYKLSL